jgi:hypothetical protein
VVGWSWLVEPHRWQFSCRTLNDVRGIKFDAFWLRNLCESDHELGFHLTKYLLQVVANRLTALRLAYQGNAMNRPAPLASQKTVDHNNGVAHQVAAS